MYDAVYFSSIPTAVTFLHKLGVMNWETVWEGEESVLCRGNTGVDGDPLLLEVTHEQAVVTDREGNRIHQQPCAAVSRGAPAPKDRPSRCVLKTKSCHSVTVRASASHSGKNTFRRACTGE